MVRVNYGCPKRYPIEVKIRCEQKAASAILLGQNQRTGANYLTSKTGLWFTLADCFAAQLLTGKPVEVLQAIVFKHGPPQRDLRPVAISGNPDYLVDPYKE
jgi:hypothetical protein